MIIKSLYRITSHCQLVEVDDVSTSFNKVSNQVLIVEGKEPGFEQIKPLLADHAIGTIAIVDKFTDGLKPFNKIAGCENMLEILKHTTINGNNAVICIPEGFITFYIAQKLEQVSKIFSIKIITVNDRVIRGAYDDKLGPAASNIIIDFFKQINKQCSIEHVKIADSSEELAKQLAKAKQTKTDLLITIGGTGLGLRDITVETVKPYIDRELPGIMESIRFKFSQTDPDAVLFRGVAGIMDKTLVYTIPGNTEALNGYLIEIFLTLDKLFYMIHGIDKE